MLISYRGVVDEGRVRLREAVTLPEGAEVIATALSTEVDPGEPTEGAGPPGYDRRSDGIGSQTHPCRTRFASS
jgi:hypothetical protein